VDDVFLQLRFSVFPGLASSRRIWRCSEFYPEMSPDLNVVFSSLEESSRNSASHFAKFLEWKSFHMEWHDQSCCSESSFWIASFEKPNIRNLLFVTDWLFTSFECMSLWFNAIWLLQFAYTGAVHRVLTKTFHYLKFISSIYLSFDLNNRMSSHPEFARKWHIHSILGPYDIGKVWVTSLRSISRFRGFSVSRFWVICHFLSDCYKNSPLRGNRGRLSVNGFSAS
jgi:hypothetical protein